MLIHNSDTAVKPIIGNKDIERQGTLDYRAGELPFEAWNAETVAQKIDSMQLETHLHEVYNAMGASSTVNEKLNVLIYFESIILNSNVANRLINSAFMSILMKLLKNVKHPHLKMRLCSILGQLVRHSTVIGNDVAESGLSSLLCEVVKDKEAKESLSQNGTSAPHAPQTVLKDGSRDVLQSERTDETSMEENGGRGYHQRLERMGAMSKEWEAFLRSIAIGGEGVVDSV